MTVQGLVTVSLRFWAPAALYWVLAGALLASARYAASPGAPPARGPSAWVRFGAVALAVAAVALVVSVPGARAEWLSAGGRLQLNRAYRAGRLDQNDYVARAVANYRRAMEASRYLPDYYHAFESLGRLYARAGELPRAVGVYEALDAQAPGYGEVRLHLGRYCARMARAATDPGMKRQYARDALAWYAAALEQNPYHYRARLDIVDLLVRTAGRSARAEIVAHLAKVADAPPMAKLDPFKLRALDLAGALLARLGDGDAAREVIEVKRRLVASLAREAQSVGQAPVKTSSAGPVMKR
jgi:tetratricopeptide (TPR) repeat protein